MQVNKSHNKVIPNGTDYCAKKIEIVVIFIIEIEIIVIEI